MVEAIDAVSAPGPLRISFDLIERTGVVLTNLPHESTAWRAFATHAAVLAEDGAFQAAVGRFGTATSKADMERALLEVQYRIDFFDRVAREKGIPMNPAVPGAAWLAVLDVRRTNERVVTSSLIVSRVLPVPR